MKWISFIALLPLGMTQVALCADLSISSLKITYKDNVSVPGKVIVRELKSFQDDTFWSKPTKVNVTVRVRNASKDETAIAVVVRPEMYVLLDRKPGSRFPSLSMGRLAQVDYLRGVTELKSKMTGPVWVWNRTGKGTPIELKPGQEMKVEIKDVDIANQFTPSDYDLLGIAIRVFVDSRVSKDPDYSNNVVDAIIMYGA